MRIGTLVAGRMRVLVDTVITGLVLGFLLSASWTNGQTVQDWNAWDPADVDFHTPAHWTPAGPPGVDDTARFNQSETNRVELSSVVTNTSLMVQQLLAAAGIDMAFDLGGNTWTLTSTAAGDSAGLVVGRSAASTMRLTNGTLAVGSYAIGVNDGSDAALILSGTNTLLTSTTGSYLGYNHGSRGSLRIEDGAQALLFNLRSGIFSTSQSESMVLVTGSGSLLQTSDALRMQGGTVRIEAGGRANVGILSSSDPWTNNQYLVTGAGSSMAITNSMSITTALR